MRSFFYGCLAVLLSGCADESDSLTLFCAAGLRPPISEVAEIFEARTGTRIITQFGGSGTLLSQLTIAKADLFLAADSSFMDMADERGLVSRRREIAIQKPVLVRRRGVDGCESIADLGRNDLRVGIGDPEASAIGRVTRSALQESGLGLDFKPTATFATVFELANALELGTIDVAILWDNVAAKYPELEIVPAPALSKFTSSIEIAVLKQARLPESAGKFCDFLANSPDSRRILLECGFLLPES